MVQQMHHLYKIYFNILVLQYSLNFSLTIKTIAVIMIYFDLRDQWMELDYVLCMASLFCDNELVTSY